MNNAEIVAIDFEIWLGMERATNRYGLDEELQNWEVQNYREYF